MGPTLLGNEFYPSNWLRDTISNASGIPEELTQVIEWILALHNEGVSCLDFTGDGSLGGQDWEQAAKEAASRVAAWQRTADRGKLGYQPATAARRFLACNRDSVLKDAIDAIVADNRNLSTWLTRCPQLISIPRE